MEERPPLTRWGSYDQLMSGETSNPSVHSPVNILEREVDKLKGVMVQQNEVIRRLADQLTPTRQALGSTKPRDISILELDQLQGLNATTQLQIFFELVEQCSDNDVRRVKIAKERVSPKIAALIHNHKTQH